MRPLFACHLLEPRTLSVLQSKQMGCGWEEAESDMDVGSCLIPHGQRFSPSTPLASKSHVNGLSVLQYSIFVLCYFEVRLEPFPAYPAICLATGPWRYAGVLTHERVLIAQHLSFSPERIVSQEPPNRITRYTDDPGVYRGKSPHLAGPAGLEKPSYLISNFLFLYSWPRGFWSSQLFETLPCPRGFRSGLDLFFVLA